MKKKGIIVLTNLRFFAALMVFLDYYIIRTLFKPDDWALSLGYIAMTFFFTLAGFVLVYSYSNELSNNSISKIKFYLPQLARIWPLHIYFILIIHPFIYPQLLTNLNKNLIFLVANILLLQDFIPHSASLFNEQSWSISAEMFFYLAFPFLINVASQTKYVFNLFILSYFFILLSVTVLYTTPRNSSLDHNIYLFGTQISIASLFNVFSIIRSFAFMMGILIFYFYSNIDKQSLSKYWYTLLVILGILLLIIYLTHTSYPRLAQLILLGEVSFAFYMFQEPVGIYIKYLFHLNTAYLQTVHLLILTLAAILIHKYLEYPSYIKIRTCCKIKKLLRSLNENEVPLFIKEEPITYKVRNFH